MVGGVIGLGVGVVGGAAKGLLCAALVTVLGTAVVGLGSEFTTAYESADTRRAIDPEAVLLEDATWTLFGSTVVILTFGATAAFVIGTRGGLLIGAAAGLVSTLTSASAEFQIARVWLFLTRRLPWRIFTFLELSYDRGVLRKVGGAYEFRHALLRDRLASRA